MRGNVLFLILLAVVLFAALAYAVTGSMRGGGKSASDETVTAQAADMMQYFSLLDAAIMRMTLVQDIKLQNISFAHAGKFGNGNDYTTYNNANCIGNACRLFHVDGGGVPVRFFYKSGVAEPSSYNPATGFMPGSLWFYMMDWPQAGTSANDLVLVIGFTKPEICAEINRQMGITVAPVVGGTWLSVTPVANWDTAGIEVLANASQLVGKSTFGSHNTGSGAGLLCHVFHLIAER